MKFKPVKRIIGTAVSVAVTMSLMTAYLHPSYSEDMTYNGVSYEYEIDGGAAILTGCTGYGSSLTLPAELGGSPLCYIGKSVFANSENLKEVTLPETVIGIETNAFYKSSVETVNFPDSLLYIDNGAFEYSSLLSAELPESVLALGMRTFYSCDSLTQVTLPANLIFCDVETFENCTSLTDIVFPEGITTLGEEMFSGCTALTSVTYPAGIKDAGYHIFSGCTNLTSFMAEDGAEVLPYGICSGNISLTDISLPDSLVSVAPFAFSGCKALDNVALPESLEEIGNSAFASCTALTEIYIPDSVISIGKRAFYDDNMLEDVQGMNNVIYIGQTAFKNTTFIEQFTDPAIVLGDGVLYEYYYDYPNTEPVMPETVKYVSPYAFDILDALKSVTFQDGLIGIWEYGMASVNGSDGLSAVYLPDSTEFIGDGAFQYCRALETITIPDTLTYIGRNALRSTAFLENCTDEFVIVGDNVLYIYQGESKDVVIPDGVKYLSGSAFDSCWSMTSVEIPDSVIEIQPGCGNNCYKLEELVIPDSVKSIGENAFSGCTSLIDLDLGNGVEYLGAEAFINSGLTEVVLPDSLKVIEAPSFGYKLISSATEYTPGKYNQIEDFAIAASWGSAGADYALKNGVLLYWIVDSNCESGDINEDGKIDIEDAALLQDMLMGRVKFTTTKCALADMNFDAQVDSIDLAILKGKVS